MDRFAQPPSSPRSLPMSEDPVQKGNVLQMPGPFVQKRTSENNHGRLFRQTQALPSRPLVFQLVGRRDPEGLREGSECCNWDRKKMEMAGRCRGRRLRKRRVTETETG